MKLFSALREFMRGIFPFRPNDNNVKDLLLDIVSAAPGLPPRDAITVAIFVSSINGQHFRSGYLKRMLGEMLESGDLVEKAREKDSRPILYARPNQ